MANRRVLVLALSAACGLSVGVACATAQTHMADGGTPYATPVGTQTITIGGLHLSTAPGLARAVDPDGTFHAPHNPGPAPRVPDCISAWKAFAGQATTRWLRALAPRPANVKINSIGGGSWLFCAVYISLDKNHLLAAYLYTQAGKSIWKGIIESPPMYDVSQFSGSLRPDGSIRMA
jgi:hypothetical protein